MLMFIGLTVFLCLIVFMTPSGKFEPCGEHVNKKRQEAKTNRWVLNMQAYRDGVELYCSPYYESTTFDLDNTEGDLRVIRI